MSTTLEIEKSLPNSVESEKVILGSIIVSNQLINEALATLEPDDFYSHKHRRVFVAMADLSSAGIAINPITIAEQLGDERERVGGISFLSDLHYGLPHFASISTYIPILKEKAARRRFLNLSASLHARTMDGEEGIEQLGSFVEQAAAEIRARAGSASHGFRKFDDVSIEAERYYAKLRDGDTSAIPTGFGELDRLTRGGIQAGDVWVIASLTGRGKSAWAIGAARSQAEEGIPVAFVSREMSDLENFTRAISGASKVPAWSIKPGINTNDYDLLMDWTPAVGQLPIWINSRTANIFEIRSQVKDLARRENIKIETNGPGIG